MATKNKFYSIIKQVHLYACLSTFTFFVMYLITSYMMIHHDTFKPADPAVSVREVSASNFQQKGFDWNQFCRTEQISGRLEKENEQKDGSMVREYKSPSTFTRVTIPAEVQAITIETREADINGTLHQLHRLGGYDGPLLFKLYAFMVDLTAIALILFTLTGIILWLQVLKGNRLAWLILVAGGLYMALVMAQLM